jgi:hypothetical protein
MLASNNHQDKLFLLTFPPSYHILSLTSGPPICEALDKRVEYVMEMNKTPFLKKEWGFVLWGKDLG